MILISILCLFVIIIGEAFIESRIGDNHHTRSFIIRCILSLAVYTFLLTPKNADINIVFVSSFLFFNIWFDPSFNLFRGNPQGYLGNNFTDRFLKRFNPARVFVARWTVSALLVILVALKLRDYYTELDKLGAYEIGLIIVVFGGIMTAAYFYVRKNWIKR